MKDPKSYFIDGLLTGISLTLSIVALVSSVLNAMGYL